MNCPLAQPDLVLADSPFLGRLLCQLLRLLSRLKDRVDWISSKDHAINESYQISHMLQDFANDRLSRSPAQSLNYGQNGAVVGEHKNGPAACAQRHCPSIHGTNDHVESCFERRQCGCKSVNPRVATHRSVVFGLLIATIYPVGALTSATNTDQLISGRRAGGYANILRLVSSCGCLHAVIYTITKFGP